MMKRHISLLVLPLLSIAACLDMSDQDPAEGASSQASAIVGGGGGGGGPSPKPSNPPSVKVEMTPWGGTPRPEIAQVLREHPGGVQINEDQIAWNDGTVVLTIPSEAQPQPQAAATGPVALATIEGCPGGWYCFYQNINFNNQKPGRRLQFMDCSINGTEQFLSNFGFDKATSSWVDNQSGNLIEVFDDSGTFLWDEQGISKASFVGTANNDKADIFICFN